MNTGKEVIVEIYQRPMLGCVKTETDRSRLLQNPKQGLRYLECVGVYYYSIIEIRQ